MYGNLNPVGLDPLSKFMLDLQKLDPSDMEISMLKKPKMCCLSAFILVCY